VLPCGIFEQQIDDGSGRRPPSKVALIVRSSWTRKALATRGRRIADLNKTRRRHASGKLT